MTSRVETLLRSYLRAHCTSAEIVPAVVLDLVTLGQESDVGMVHSLLPNDILADLLVYLDDSRHRAYFCRVFLIGPGSIVLDPNKVQKIHEILLELGNEHARNSSKEL
jgi:hypothetical protein